MVYSEDIGYSNKFKCLMLSLVTITKAFPHNPPWFKVEENTDRDYNIIQYCLPVKTKLLFVRC